MGKPRIIITLSLVIILSLIVGCMMVTNNSNEISVDLSDIEEMNIGAEMPRLLYADKSIAVIQGTFGVIVYNFQDLAVTNRISHEDIKPYGISMMLASVSQDGATIFIGNDDMFSDFTYTHQYNIKNGMIKKTKKQPSTLYKPMINDGQYDKYFESGYLMSHTVIELDGSLINLRSPDWNMKNLQIVILQYEDSESKILDVFK